MEISKVLFPVFTFELKNWLKDIDKKTRNLHSSLLKD